MDMTVSDLIEQLEGCDPNAVIRIAHQPSWPFQYSVGQVLEVTLDDAVLPDESDDLPDPVGDPVGFEDGIRAETDYLLNGDEQQTRWPTGATAVVFIGEGRQTAYLHSMAASELGWK